MGLSMSGMLGLVAVAAGCGPALALALAPAADGAWTLDPAPPPELTDAAVDAWVAANVVVGRDLQTGYNSKVVGFISTERIERPEPDVIRVWIRFETFQVASGPGARVGSFRSLTEFDCPRGRHREVAHEFFPIHNLSGVPVTDAHPDAPWQPDRAGGVWSLNAEILCAAMEMAGKSKKDAAGDGSD